MNFRIIDLSETELFGRAHPYEGQGYRNREELRHRLWADTGDDVPGQISGRWNEPGSTAMDGIWYGLWQNGSYAVARKASDMHFSGLDRFVLPAGTYAAFTGERGTLAWEELPRLRAQALELWLPRSGYRLRDDSAVEVLHLQTDHDVRQRERFYELWIPIEPNE